MKHHKILRQGLSVLLSLVMCLSLLPTTALAATSVEINETNFPDENFRTYVSEKFDTDDNKGTLSAEEIAKVTNINCFNKSISDLKGIEYFTALTTLNCSFNQLTSLDISKNVNLSELDCTRSNLITLDVSNNTKLTNLKCGRNQLTSLTVSGDANLQSLNCTSNQLTSLDVSKNTNLTELNCTENNLTTLNVNNNEKLTTLNCSYNQLTTLNVSNNTALTELNCYGNQLTTLNVSNNTALTTLDCRSNQLTTLNVSNNKALESLYCASNQLTSLDVSNTAVWSTHLSPNTYKVTLSENRTFDLSTLPGNFNVTKVLSWDGGTVEGNILTFDPGVTIVTYIYDCGIGKKATFTLDATPQYTVTFDSNDGTGTMEPVSVRGGSSYTLPENGFTAPEGTQFMGWATSADGEVIIDTSITVDGDTTLYAIWGKIYTVTVENDGNGSGTATPATAVAGTEITLSATANSGYRFKEWQVDSDVVTLANAGSATTTFTMPDSAVTVKAVFEVDEYTVTFDGNGGTPSVVSMTTAGKKLASLPTATRNGYTFNGWYTEKTGGKKVTTDTGFEDDTTVYAHWTSNGGSSSVYYPKTIKLRTTSYTYDGKVKKPKVSVIDVKGNIIPSDHYTVSYASGRKNVGKYKVTVTFKSSSVKYTGSKSTYFYINPKGTSIIQVTGAKKAFTVKWKKQSGKMAASRITGYQIRYSTSSKMTNAKTKTVKGYKNTSKKITNLKAKKKYYVQVRTYKTVGGKNYYSSWSKVKSVKTK